MNRFIFIIPLVLFSCSQNKTNESNSVMMKSRENISRMENEIAKLPSATVEELGEVNKDKKSLMDSLQEYYNKYPNDTLAPQYLDKIHMLYSGMGKYQNATEYADKILKEYPNYVNRDMIIESQIMSYDVFITPRNPEKVKYYIEMLLRENPDMNKEKRSEYEERLKNVDRSFLESM